MTARLNPPAAPPLSDWLAIASGSWTWHARPIAVTAGGYTFVGYISTAGDVHVARYNSATGFWTDSGVLGSPGEDDHNVPAILVRSSDNKLIVAWCAHSGDPAMHWRISGTAYGVDFGVENTVGASAGVTYSYAQLVELTAEGKIYLFCRHQPGTPATWWCFSSTNSGASFGTTGKALWGDNTTASAYSHPVGNGTDTIWFTRSDWVLGESSYVRLHVMCAYYKAGNVYKPDGTLMSSWANLPITDTSLFDKVYDSTGAPTIADYAFNKDIALDDDGNPVIVFATLDADYHNHAHYARWDGAAWHVTEMLDMGSDLYPTTNRTQPAYDAGLVLDHSDPTIVYLGREVGDYGSKVYRLERWQTRNGGASWQTSVVSAPNMPAKTFRPLVPYDHDGSVDLLCVSGQYSAYTDYNTALYAAGPAIVPAVGLSVSGPPAFGASAVVGVGTGYSREDHVHGLPAAPAVAESILSFTDVATANADTTKHGLARKLSGINTDVLHGDGVFASPTQFDKGLFLSSDGGVSASTFVPWQGTAITSGTTNTSLAGGADHPGANRILSSATSNSGYCFFWPSAVATPGITLAGLEEMGAVFTIPATTNLALYFGIHNSANKNAPTHGAWISILVDALTGKCADGTHAASTTGTGYTVSTGTWYRAVVRANVNNTAWTFELYTCADGVKVWSDTLAVGGTVYMPTTGSSIFNATGGSGSAINLVDLDYMNLSIPRTLVR